MKTCKKLLAVLLSLMMIASVIVIPASAEEAAAENYVSLLDMSGLRAGLFTEGDNTLFPDGLADLGVARGPYNGCGSEYYAGKQEIVELEDGAIAWKINFNKAMTGGGWYNDNKGLFVANVAVPDKYVPYITGIKMDMINASNGQLQYQFGVKTGSYLAKNMKESLGSTTTPDAPVELNLAYDITALNKRNAYGAFNGGGEVAGAMTYGEDIEYIYFSLKDTEAEDGGLGYAIIKDIGVTLSIPEADIPVEKEYSILDLTEANVGDTFEGSAAIIPGVKDATVAGYNGTGSKFTGKQEIVEVDGEKAWKIHFNTAQSGGGYMWDSKELFAVKIAVPTKYLPYISGVGIDVENKTATSLRYVMGWENTAGLSKFGSTVTTGTDVDVTKQVAGATLYTSVYSCFNDGNSKSETPWAFGDDISYVYLLLREGVTTEAGGTGYAIIKDISVTVKAAPSVHENMPTEKEYSIFDLSESYVGAKVDSGTVAFPEGVEAGGVSKFSSGWEGSHKFNGSQEIVEVDGKKAWKINFDQAMKSNSNICDVANEFMIKVAIPTPYVPYVTSVKFDITNKSAKQLGYSVGITTGSNASWNRTGGNSYEATAATTVEEIVAERNVTELWKRASLYAACPTLTEKWTVGEATYVYILMTSQGCDGTEGGYAIINDITITVSASASQFAAMPVSTKVSAWDLSANELGTIAGSAVKYNKGTTGNAYSGALEIVEDERYGTKALRFDLANTEFTNKDGGDEDTLPDNGGRLNEHSYSPTYQAIANVIPSTYVPYIDSIKIRFNKQTESNVRYNFGVTDGSQYSKLGDGANSTLGASDTGYVTKILNPDDLYKCSSYQAGGYSDPRNGSKWNGDFTALFIRMSADNGATGYIDIVDIEYTYTMTAAQKAEADAKWNEMKAFITSFESSGTVSDKATSGEKVHTLWSGDGYSGGNVTLNTNIYLNEANGFSFWMYNPNESAQSPKFWLNTTSGDRYIISTGYSIAANSYAKVTVDFNKVYEWAGDNGGYNKGALISLTEEQKESITNINFLIRPAKTSLLVDDFYLVLDEIADEKLGAEIDITADNVTGGTVTEDGKIEIPVAAEDQVVAIKIPTGTLTEAGTLTYKLSSTATVNTNLKFYMGLTRDNGTAGHVKIGQNPWSYSIAAGATLDQAFNFFATRELRVFDGSWYINNWQGDGSTPPTASEKASITTIYLAVKGYGTVAEGAEAPTGSIFIEGFDLVNVGVKISATEVEGGSTTLIDEKVFVGEKASLVISPEAGYYLKALNVVDSLGNAVAYERNTEYGAENLGLYYSFVVPAANVTVTPEFGAIEGTMPYESAYEGDNLNLDFTIPFVDGKVYNESVYGFETLADYGIIIASEAALNKYGYTVEDLTAELADELIASGHYLSNYIYKLDGKDAIKTANNANFIKFSVEVTDVSVNARRAPLTMITYANFTDSEGTESTPVTTINYNTMDMMVYGDNLVEEFYANNGINYQSSLTADLSVWEDIYAQGFDHIRLPINMTSRIDENYQLIEEKMAEVDLAIDNALRAGFSVVVDTHSMGVNISSDYANSAEVYNTVWAQLAERYAHLPLSVAFQFVNEPMTNKKTETAEDGTVTNPDPLSWDELMVFQENLVDICRAVEGSEDRYMVISNHNNGSWALGQFTESIMSKGNIIIDIHYYSPMSFTHSGNESWDNIEGNGYVSGATDYSEADFVGFATRMAEFAEANGVTVWVGEWGAYQPDYTAKVAYYAEFAQAMSDAGVPWSLWEYGSGFSPYKNGVWDQEILDAIFSFDAVNDTAAEEA